MRETGFAATLTLALALPLAAPAMDVWYGSFVSTNVTLTRDLVGVNSSFDGLRVIAHNITIDGNGYALERQGDLGATDVFGILNYGYTNVTIKNFSRIAGFVNGIRVRGDISGMVVENCRIEDNAEGGVRTSHSATGLTLRDNVFRESFAAADLREASGIVATGNRMVGGRVGIIADPGSFATFSGNRLEHQAQRPWPDSRGLFRFTQARRTGEPLDTFDFSLTMTALENGTAAADSLFSMRTVPSLAVETVQDGAVVAGSFVPVRAGLHSLIAEVEDTRGNVETRAIRVYVGPTEERSLVGYWSDRYPQHGQARRGQEDSGSMDFLPPAASGYLLCGGWVQVSFNPLPVVPAGLLTGADFNMLFRYMANPSWPPRLGLQRDVYFGGTPDATVAVTAPATGDAEWGGESVWSEHALDGLDWALDYPVEWRYLGAYFQAQNPYVETGVPGLESHTVLRYRTTVSPEVRSVSGPNTLLLAATTDPGNPADTRLVLAATDDAETQATVAGFRRPFLDTPSLVGATGDTVLRAGALTGETSFVALPLELVPAADAVLLRATDWTTAGNERKAWLTEAEGAPGTVSHGLSGLTPETDYRIAVNGETWTNLQSDTLGQTSFDYDGLFPAQFLIMARHADSDGDGIPDWWEEKYFGGATQAVATALAASGIHTVLETYIAGINPTNPAARFAIENLRLTDPGVALQFDSARDRAYTLEYKDDLTDPAPWQSLGAAEAGTGARLEMPDATQGVSRRFYRIRVALSE